MMKLISKAPLVLIVALVMMLNACKKDKEAVKANDSISAQDDATVASAMDASSDDAAAAAGQVSGFSGKTEGWWHSAVLCGSTAVDTGNGHSITITYDGGQTCKGLRRSGSITVALTNGTHWSDMGATLSVTFNSLKVTDVNSGSEFTLSGTHSVVNETGGLAWMIIAGLSRNTTVSHRTQTHNMSVTFSDGTQRSWMIDRTVSWNSSDASGRNIITLSVYSENAGHVDITGTNRFGETFVNSIPITIAANNYNLLCWWMPYQGQYIHQTGSRTTTVTFGTDSHGNAMGSPTECSDGYYITYTENGQTVSKFVRYWH